MSGLLLDTHVLLWLMGAPRQLSLATRKRIDLAQVLVSAASLWEITIKVGLGKLDADPGEIWRALEPAGISALPIAPEHALAVARLPPLHGDPFDRMLVAQARFEGLTLLTRDAAVLAYGQGVERA